MTQPTLLLVEPSDPARRAVGDLLRRSGYGVVEAADGAEGFRIAREVPVALVVAEVWPFFCGSLQMMEMLRQERDTRDVPVLVLTAAVSSEYRERALHAGCAAYLDKSCGSVALLAEVRRLAGGTTIEDPRAAAMA